MSTVPTAAARPLGILVASLGGEGGGVLAEWLVEAATQAGYVAQSTSIPGVAQRTGATTYYVEIFPVPMTNLGNRRPILGLYPVPGAIDLLLASELLETGRMLQAGMASRERTVLVTSSSRTLTTAEKMALGDGRFPDDRLLATARAHSRELIAFDMAAAARDAGTVVSAVMLGAVAATGLLPFGAAVFEAVVRAAGIGVEGSLRGFAAGVAAVRIARAEGTPPRDATEAGATRPSAEEPPAATGPSAEGPPAATGPSAEWPRAIASIASLGAARLRDFQDERYAELYRARVRAVLASERAVDPTGQHGLALTREVARFLALWMAYDDIVRVAALKARASRFARVRQEVGAKPGDVVRIIDHYKPGVPELAGMLPRSWASRMTAWDARRKARGAAPWAWPIHLRADTVSGWLLLRGLASLRRLRRVGSRHAQEQALIEGWLAAVHAAAHRDWQLAHEIGLCGRLVKGYGETNERGKRNLAHILEHLAERGRAPAERASAIAEAREAALGDEGGKALDATLARHGAPARPLRAQPIRLIKNAARPAPRPTTDLPA